MSTIVRSIPLPIPTTIPTKLLIRHRVPIMSAIALLAIRSHRRPRRLPSLAFARLLLVGESATRGFGPFGVKVVQLVDAAAGVLAADVEV